MQTEAAARSHLSSCSQSLNERVGIRKYATHSVQQSQIGTVSQLFAGGIAGAVSKTCTAPLARFTILFQTNVAYYSGISHALCTICRDEGTQGLYKGLGATLLAYRFSCTCEPRQWKSLRNCIFNRGILPEYYKVVPSLGIAFMTYETMKMLLSDASI